MSRIDQVKINKNNNTVPTFENEINSESQTAALLCNSKANDFTTINTQRIDEKVSSITDNIEEAKMTVNNDMTTI